MALTLNDRSRFDPEHPSLSIPLYRCVNGEQALAFLFRRDPYTNPENAPRPGLVLLDLNLPGTDGREVLCQIKRDKNLKTIPVIVFTTSSSPNDIESCYQKGANSYIIKPINFNQLKQSIQTILDFWFTANTPPIDLSEAGAS
ncbi:MAG: response regulator [Acaryochloridaceae cyanobacterium RU_4_10]|nr:response regulator [Acaryochloridaceae cyanobacterium RU_4_10]